MRWVLCPDWKHKNPNNGYSNERKGTQPHINSNEEKYKHIPQLIFTGYVKENQVEMLFNKCAVVVFPYTSTTGSSGVLHQAGSYGKAVVMPNLGDLASLISKGMINFSSALNLSPDLDRIARAENFVEDGKIDARRDWWMLFF